MSELPGEGADALGHPDPQALRRAGKTFICMYTKATTRAEIDRAHAAGLTVFLISEKSGRDSLLGGPAGAIRAREDQAFLRSVGAPPGVAVIAAETDFEPTTAQLPTIAKYYLGHQGVLHADSGAYGDFAVMVALWNAGYRGVLFQTYGWSHGRIAPHLAMMQYLNGQKIAGVGVDFDRTYPGVHGGWPPPGAKPPVVVKPAPPKPLPHPVPVPHPAPPAKPTGYVGYLGPIGWKVPAGVDPRRYAMSIATLQHCLRGAGYTGVKVTGIYDPATNAAIRSWQARHKAVVLKDFPCGPGGIKKAQFAALLAYWGKA